MAKTINLAFSEEEVEMLIDALEADMEGYVEAAKEARVKGNREDLTTFTEAAQRILALKGRLEDLIE